MRDIRPDLTERLQAIAARREDLKAQILVLNQKEASIRALLDEEESRWEDVQPRLFTNGKAPEHREPELVVGRTPLARFLVRTLADGRPHILAEIVEQAAHAQLDFGAKNPGRSIHFALIGLQQNKFVRRLEDGAWQWRSREDREIG